MFSKTRWNLGGTQLNLQYQKRRDLNTNRKEKCTAGIFLKWKQWTFILNHITQLFQLEPLIHSTNSNCLLFAGTFQALGYYSE